MLALDDRDRVATLTLMSTSPIDQGDPGLPGWHRSSTRPSQKPVPEPDWTDRAAVIDYIVEAERAFAAPDDFDGPRLSELAGRVVDRSDEHRLEHDQPLDARRRRPRATATRALAGCRHSSSTALEDPLFPYPHGEAMARAIPGAELVGLEGAGHELPRAGWDVAVPAILRHTSR